VIRKFSLVAASACLLAAAPAQAQDPTADQRVFSEGVDRPIHDYSGEGDASSLELNPALLSAVEGFDLTLRGYSAISDYVRGSGFGGWMSANLFGIAVGLGVQFIQPGFDPYDRAVFDYDGANNFDRTKLSFGISGGDARYGSFGIAFSGVRRSGTRMRQPDLDLGAMLRMTNYASLGLAARLAPIDLDQGAFGSQVGLVGELAVRPLGTRHLELAGGVRASLDASNDGSATTGVLYPRARASVRLKGWTISGEAEQVRADVLDENTLAFKGTQRAWRGSVALGLSWDYMSVESGVHLGQTQALDGVGYMARFSSRRQGRIYWPRKVDAERIDLKKVDDERSLIHTLERVRRAKLAGDRSVLVVDARGFGMGWASAQELRRALADVRNAGGHVFAYLEGAGMQDYYLASMAEQVYMHPAGELQITGLSTVGIYLRDALAKLGVRVEAFHIREYKSAHERWSRNSRSIKDRAQRTALLQDTFDVFVHDVAQARGLSKADVVMAIEDAPYGPKQAVDLKFIDELSHRDELLEKVSERIGADVSFGEFTRTEADEPTWSDQPYIAVIMVEGGIVDGKGRSLPILNIINSGADTITELIKRAREDRACRGIIVRVNSPGGSALASDLIWREVALTQQKHEKDPKSTPPIVVSMGDYAASGGYYVSVGAKHILAQPTTITGSIGVVGMHWDVSGLLRILGINTDTIKFGENADMDTLWKPYTKDQAARQQASMERVYTLFVKRVADGRELKQEKVDELGRGHVYSGKAAKKLKLVDQLGGLHQAIELIRKETAVGRRFRLPLRVYPEERTLLDLVLDNTGPLIKGPVTRARARKLAKSKPGLPLALDAALARLPLSILFLPQGASLIMDAQVRVE
jgi:protease-4